MQKDIGIWLKNYLETNNRRKSKNSKKICIDLF